MAGIVPANSGRLAASLARWRRRRLPLAAGRSARAGEVRTSSHSPWLMNAVGERPPRRAWHRRVTAHARRLVVDQRQAPRRCRLSTWPARWSNSPQGRAV